MKCYDVSRLPSMIELGFDGENNWRPNSFDCSSLLKNHPSGVISLWLLPNGESQAFPVALERDGNTVVWTPLSEEMTAEHGALQIVCTDGTDVGKSSVVMFRVDESILPGADHPAAVPSWATQVMEQYQNAIEHYPTIIDSTWHVWDVDNETWEDTGVSAQGVDGEDGHSPYIALNGHWMVYSDSTHEWIDTGVPASVDEAVIANAVAAYLDEHPITVTETDPTVPQWAKNPTKPTYTAAEVGALPSSYTPPVESVNGKTGAVNLSASDVHALPDSYTPPVESVNGKTGAVVLDAEDVGALPADTPIPAAVTEQTVAGWGFTKNTGTYSKPSGGIPKADLASDVQTSLGKADTALQTAPVTSVNNKTGAVTVKTPIYLTYDSTTNTVDKTHSEIDALSAAGYDVHLRLPMALEQLTAVADMRYIAILNVAAFYGVVLFGSRPIIATATVDAQKRVNYVLSAVATQSDIPSLSGYATETWVEDKGYQTAQDVQTAISPFQTKAITDTGGYFTTDTVEGALQEIGAELAGVNTLIGSGVIS